MQGIQTDMDGLEKSTRNQARLVAVASGATQRWLRTAHGAFWQALDCATRASVLAKESRQQIHKSDNLLRWCESFGPRPKSEDIL